MKPRKIIEVDIPEEMISNGDTFHIMRLDGLDPMIAWAKGSTTGIFKFNLYIIYLIIIFYNSYNIDDFIFLR